MTTRILYSQTTQTGKMVAQYVNAVFEARAQGRRLKAILDSASAAADWAAIGAEVGGGIDATQAQNLWTITSNAQAAIDVAGVAELARLDQG